MNYTVFINFEASDEAEAKAMIGSWTITPGLAMVVSAQPGVPPPPVSAIADESGAPVIPPALTELQPATVIQNGQVQVHAIGDRFTDTAKLVFDGVELATAYVSQTELYCTIDASTGGHAPGSFPMLVRQDGVDTPPLTFTITAASE